MAKNPVRQEVTFSLTEDGKEYEFTVKPTLERIFAIEAELGPAFPLAQRLLSRQSSTREIVSSVQAILRGLDGAPKDATIAQLMFDRGVYTYAIPAATFIIEGIKAGDEEKPGDQPAGN